MRPPEQKGNIFPEHVDSWAVDDFEKTSATGLIRFFRAKIDSVVHFADKIISSPVAKFLPAAVFATTLGTTVELWRNEVANSEADIAREADRISATAERSISDRLAQYDHVFHRIEILIRSAGSVQSWRFVGDVDSLKLPDEYPEILGVDVFCAASGTSLPIGFSKAYDSEYSPPRMRFPTIKTEGHMGAERHTRTITEPLPISPNRNADSENSSFVISSPLVSGTHDGLSDGWISITVRSDGFMRKALEQSLPIAAVSVYDGGVGKGAGRALFDSKSEKFQGGSELDRIRTARIFDRIWTITTEPFLETFPFRNRGREHAIVLTGGFTTVALTLLFWFLIRSRGNLAWMLKVLESVVSQATKSEARYRTLFSDSQVVMVVIDPATGVIMDMNRRAIEYYGFPQSENAKFHVSDILDATQKEISDAMDKARSGEADYFKFRGRIASGETRDIEMTTAKIEISEKDELVSIIHDVTERNISSKRMFDLATLDALTGLPNRSLVADRLEKACAHADRSGGSVALIFVDLDHFKEVNDLIGHDVWDDLLKEAASRMQAAVRAEDTVGRQGGDEFLVVLPEISDASDASNVAEKIVFALSEPFKIRGHDVHISASVGIATYPKDADSVDSLMKFGDVAMYQAKRSGRNGYRFFSPEMHKESAERNALANALRHALERGEFSVNFQSVVGSGDSKILGMEALLRWNSAEFGSVSPAKFIPIAENTGLIVPIGEWVIREVCRQVAEWKSAGVEPPRVAVNLSGRQFRMKTLADDIIRIMRETWTDPRYVGLEITESMLMEDVQETVRTLSRLNEFGFELSIDDFGTGYSSLSYLKRFPVKKLKIDRSFVTDIAENHEDLLIARSTIALAHGLDMKVVAEGIENEDQARILKSLGCDFFQGYYFGKPAIASEVTRRLSKNRQSDE